MPTVDDGEKSVLYENCPSSARAVTENKKAEPTRLRAPFVIHDLSQYSSVYADVGYDDDNFISRRVFCLLRWSGSTVLVIGLMVLIAVGILFFLGRSPLI